MGASARSASRVTFLPSSTNRLSFRTAGDGAQVMVVEFIPGERPHALPEFETMLPRVAERAQPPLIATRTASSAPWASAARRSSRRAASQSSSATLRAVEANWPKIKFHAMREHAGLVFHKSM